MLATGRQRSSLALVLVAATALTVWFSNQILPHVRDETQGWNQAYLFPRMNPVGADFRAGVYVPGAILAQGRDPYLGTGLWYPPFSALLFLPYQLVDAGRAYSIHVFLIVLLSIASVGCAIRISDSTIRRRSFSQESHDPWMTLPLCLSLIFLTVSSYGFVFGVERGNIDLYPMAIALAGLWILVRSPKRVWLPVLCLSVAAHLKVYPAVLLLLPLWKHGRGSLVPIVLVNTALLFCIGPGPAVSFIKTLSGVAISPETGAANHSAASFGLMVNGFLGERAQPPVPEAVFLALPVLVWAASALLLLRKGYSESGAVWLFAVSVPLMNLIPSTSHDYKLVLLSAPFAMLLTTLLKDYTPSGRRSTLAQIAAACVLLFFLGVSYVQLPSVLANKYPFILGTQGLLLWVLLMRPSNRAQDLSEAPLGPDVALRTA